MKIVKISENREFHIHNNRFSLYSGNCRLFSFYVACPVNADGKADCDSGLTLVSDSETEYIWASKSNIWKKKEYRLVFTAFSAVFTLRVTGRGAIDIIEYFKGTPDGIGSPFSVAGYTLFNCQNTDRLRSSFLMDAEPAVLHSLRCAPPPFLFPFWNELTEDYVGVGLAAKKGQHNFADFTMHAPRNGWKENGCHFSVDMNGYTGVDGEFECPMIWMGFGRDEYDVLRKYSDMQYNFLGFGKNIPSYSTPAWWRRPIFCGWGEQCALRDRGTGEKAPDNANETIYNSFSDRLDSLGLDVGSVIIDDKWQEKYGTLIPDKNKWNTLRSFSDLQHSKGRRVILWFKSWDMEGLPEDECIKVNGQPFCADPTNPKYLERLKKTVYSLLADDDGCGCDGFKIDFMDCFPKGSGIEAFEKGVYGLELMKRLFSAVYTFAKEAKADALINMSSAHPYFSENCDMFRIHDYDPTLRNPVGIMRFRSEFAGAVMPDVLIDTDGFSAYTRPESLNIILSSEKFGVADLYFFPQTFTPEDWREIKEMFDGVNRSI